MTEPSKNPPAGKRQSAFADLGLPQTVELLKQEIKDLYRADAVPWIIGYSGGKDSTATLQLVWLAIRELPEDERQKPVHVISTDTLVENPIVAGWVTRSLEVMKSAAEAGRVPFVPHRLTPTVENSFWVNLIGRGYPAPRPKFRWCTERLKIKPSNTFITRMIHDIGQTILVLGTRKAESAARAKAMTHHERHRTRDRLSPNASLQGSLVYSPIEDWSNDDVWLFLMQVSNPWGHNNKELLTMYAGASPDGECPLVVDTSTPSCGDSRFGCWVCTLVDKDKSMAAMVQNDQEKEWMLPLMKFRDELDLTDDRNLRDFRRMSGAVQLFHDRPIPGPYTQAARERWLQRLLETQTWVTKNAPPSIAQTPLITVEELQEIRRIWVVDKHELEDSLPRIYREATGTDYPGAPLDDNLVLREDDMRLLAEVCGPDRLHYELTRELLDIGRRQRNMARRSTVYSDIEKAFRRSFYDDEADATAKVRRDQAALQKARDIREQPLLPIGEALP